jgi:hypothetical protein
MSRILRRALLLSYFLAFVTLGSLAVISYWMDFNVAIISQGHGEEVRSEAAIINGCLVIHLVTWQQEFRRNSIPYARAWNAQVDDLSNPELGMDFRPVASKGNVPARLPYYFGPTKRWSNGYGFSLNIFNNLYWAFCTHYTEASAPMWFILCFPAGIIYALKRRDFIRSRRRITGHCIECGYDLRGSDGTCPECGSSESDRQPSISSDASV